MYAGPIIRGALKYIGNSDLLEKLYKAWYKRIDDNLNFYLDYQIADSKLDTNLNIYYPKIFDIQRTKR